MALIQAAARPDHDFERFMRTGRLSCELEIHTNRGGLADM